MIPYEYIENLISLFCMYIINLKIENLISLFCTIINNWNANYVCDIKDQMTTLMEICAWQSHFDLTQTLNLNMFLNRFCYLGMFFSFLHQLSIWIIFVFCPVESLCMRKSVFSWAAAWAGPGYFTGSTQNREYLSAFLVSVKVEKCRIL